MCGSKLAKWADSMHGKGVFEPGYSFNEYFSKIAEICKDKQINKNK